VVFLRVNVSALIVVAGFQVIIGGRFWVITEGQPPVFDFVLYHVRRHISPAEPCEQHRFFGTKIGQAPSSTGKHAPIFPSRQS
jgi:hypothetical protein